MPSKTKPADLVALSVDQREDAVRSLATLQ